MAKVALITVCLVVVCLGMVSGATKKCYQCNPSGKETCETFNDNQLVDCPKDCVKIVNKPQDGTTQYTRGCFTGEDSCDKVLENVPNVECYQCSEDKCNSSTTFMASLSLVAILSLIIRQFV